MRAQQTQGASAVEGGDGAQSETGDGVRDNSGDNWGVALQEARMFQMETRLYRRMGTLFLMGISCGI